MATSRNGDQIADGHALIDLCDSRLGTSVTCDQISSDGYEVDNLISPEFWKKQNGYMSERFIKPPINITFHFPCPVSIWRIIVDPVIGSQKSSSIAIYSTSSGLHPLSKDCSTTALKTCKVHHDNRQNSRIANESGSPNLNTIVSVSQYKHTGNTKRKETSTQSKFSESQRQISRYLEICLGRINMTIPQKACFQDKHFSGRISTRDFEDFRSFVYCCELRHVRQVYNATHITVRICQTQSGSVGAVKMVKIWGHPTKWCPKELVKRLYERHKEGDQKINEVKTVESAIVNKTVSYKDSNSIDLFTDRRKVTTIDLPEEFLDPLSCDIMTIPMLLPCGRNIDKTSLDKYVNIEASWGRQPSDPFTGVLFTSESYPIPNDALKGRIDHFLISNREIVNVQNLPRTVSTIYEKQSAVKRKSSEIPDVTQVKKFKTLSTTSARGDLQQPSTSGKSVKSVPQPDVSSTTNRLDSSAVTHANKLQDSLESALSNVLGNFPSFRKTINTMNIISENKVCCVCKQDEEIRYGLDCNHILCRDCLMKVGEESITCHQCNHVTKKTEIKRVHR